MTEFLSDGTALALAMAWPGIIWAIVEAVKRTKRVPKRVLPLIPLVIGALTGPTMVEIMVMSVDGVETFPLLHSIVVGLGAGAFASSIHDTRSGVKKEPRD